MSLIIWFLLLVLVIVILGVLMSRKKECTHFKENGKCVDTCINKIYDYTTESCVSKCPTGTSEIMLDGGWKVCSKCPDGKAYKDGSCIDQSSCKDYGYLKITKNGVECVNNCGSGYIGIRESNSQYCLPDCKSSEDINPITLKCRSSCPPDFPNGIEGFCDK